MITITLARSILRVKKTLQCIEFHLLFDIFAIDVLLFRYLVLHTKICSTFSTEENQLTDLWIEVCEFWNGKKASWISHLPLLFHIAGSCKFVLRVLHFVDKVWKLVQKPKWLHHEKMRSDAIAAFQFDPFRRPTTQKVHSCLMLAYESSMQVHGD